MSVFKKYGITFVIRNFITYMQIGLWRGSAVRLSGFGWRTFPDLCLIYG